MTKQRLQKYIINRKVCICKNKLKQKINFGNLPLINNYKRKKNLTKYPEILFRRIFDYGYGSKAFVAYKIN